MYALDHDIDATRVLREVAATKLLANFNARNFSFGEPLPPPADVVLVAALLHWVFCFTAGSRSNLSTRFAELVRYLLTATRRWLIVEWVEPWDPAVRVYHHFDRCPDPTAAKAVYTLSNFRAALEQGGTIVSAVKPKYNHRTLFLVKKVVN